MDEKPALDPEVAVGKTLLAVARSSLAEARRALDGGGRSDAESVHDFRKAMKRWRALLRLLEPHLGKEGQRLRLAARDLARRLAGARDVQSAIEALEDLGRNRTALPTRARADMLKNLRRVRSAAEASILTADARLHLRSALATAEDSAARWQLDGLQFADVADGLAATYRRARRSVPGDWKKSDAKMLHALRQRVVEHRYQMELVEPLWPKLGRVWTGEAQRLRDRLGGYQDLVLLARFAQPHRPLASWRAQIEPIIAARQKDLAKSAARIAARLFAETPKAFRRRLTRLWDARAKSRA